MEHRIETLPETKLIGQTTIMSVAENKTRELWQGFGPRKSEIPHVVNTDLYSVEIYPPNYFENFDSTAPFEKWAAVEVSEIGTIPAQMESLILPEGLYAVFTYKGPPSEGHKAYQYIYTSWLPQSGYLLDDRPHFALMGSKYKGEDPDSEEELWIPIKHQS